jgi:OOP family OmpA-OmpF porin
MNSTIRTSVGKLRHILATVCVLGLAGMSAPAQAQELYGGISFGNGRVTDFTLCDELLDFVLDSGSNCSSDDSTTSWKLFFGNRFNPNAAVEFGYVDLGTASVSGSGSLGGIPVIVDGDWSASGLAVSLVGRLPMGDGFGVTGRIGMFLWGVDLDGVGGTESASGTSLNYGIGFQYDFLRATGLRLEWERFTDVGDDIKTGQSDVDLLTAGIVFRF